MLPAFGEASTLIEQCDGVLDDTEAQPDDEAPNIGAPDDLNVEAVELCDGGWQLLSSVAAIGEEAAQRQITVLTVDIVIGRDCHPEKGQSTRRTQSNRQQKKATYLLALNSLSSL